MWLPHRIMVEGLWLCPQRVTNKTGWQTYFLLCWTFRVPTVKEINLFLQAHVSPIFLFLACLPFPFHDPVSPFPNVSAHCALSPPHTPTPCFPFPPFSFSLEEGQVQGSPITQRGLRKLYGFCPRGCHLGLSSGRFAGTQRPLAAGTAAAFVPAPGCIDPARFRPSSCLTGYLAPNNLPPPTLVKLPGSTNMYV